MAAAWRIETSVSFRAIEVERVGEAQFDLDLGIERGEVGQDRRQQVMRRHRVGRQTDAARCLAVEPLHRVEPLEQRRLGLERLRQQPPPGGGQGQAVRAPPEELCAQLRLQRLDLAAQGRMGAAQLLGCRPERPVSRNRQKGRKRFPIHDHPDRK